MCGICGEITRDGQPADVGAVTRMMDVMVPRGPDGHGLVARDGFAFGHRRLKIIDLSECAQQPMVDAQLGLSIVYNGAIYNYRELRAELEEQGYRFFSSGDTEVILKAYHAWGEGSVDRLNGMFAFVIFERATGEVFLARDRAGIKPLYYSEAGGVFRFASSLPALLAAGGVDTSINAEALNYYMSFHSIVPAPLTLINGIRKIPPATIGRFGADGKLKLRRYWRLNFGTPETYAGYTETDWKEATLEVLRKAVKRRLVADVPVGVLLSGGLDSSLIVGLLCEHDSQAVETFSIGFETVGDEVGDEFKYSDVIVERFGTTHHKLFVNSNDALEPLKACIGQMSEPMVSHDNVGFYLLSKEVSKFVKVVQSGQGADEIFAGYHWYPPMLKSEDPVRDYSCVFFDRDHAEYCEAVSTRFHGEDHARGFVERAFAEPGADRAVDRALRLDALTMLVDDPVKRVDNNTMAASLEARVPFLDHEVMEFAAMVPPELKVRNGGKYILQQAARDVIPHAVIDRPKGYFPVPALKYLRGPFLDFAREALLNDVASQRGLFNRSYVERLLAKPEAHLTPLRGSKLWQCALLERWLQTHGI